MIRLRCVYLFPSRSRGDYRHARYRVPRCRVWQMPPEFMQILSPSYRVASSGHPRLVSGSVNQLPHTQTLTQKHTQTMMLPPSSTFNKTRQIILQKKQKKKKKKIPTHDLRALLFHHLHQVADTFFSYSQNSARTVHILFSPPVIIPQMIYLFSPSIFLLKRHKLQFLTFSLRQKKKRILNKTRLFSNWSR